MILKLYTWLSHTVSRDCFYSIVFAVLPWRAYRNLWPSGLNVLKIKIIM